jgi:Fic family protein
MAIEETLMEIEALRRQLTEAGPMRTEAEAKLWKKFRLEWNYNSNHIEGNTLTYSETLLLLLFDKTTGDHEMREYEEMQAHDVAIHQIREWAGDKERPITETDIRNLNKTILVKPFWKEAITLDGQATRRQIKVGEYKEQPNSVRLKNGEIFEYASPDETPRLMGELMEWYRENAEESPVILAAEFHYRLVRIHPFDDGNGRVCRLLMNYILMRAGLPPIVIKSADKERYITALNKADVGDREAFHQYFGEQVLWSLKLAGKAARGESVEEEDDIDKEIKLFVKSYSPSQIHSVPKSIDIIKKIIIESISGLFQIIDSKLSPLKSLFFGQNTVIELHITQQSESTND